mgnify:CR=1 FL=1
MISQGVEKTHPDKSHEPILFVVGVVGFCDFEGSWKDPPHKITRTYFVWRGRSYEEPKVLPNKSPSPKRAMHMPGTGVGVLSSCDFPGFAISSSWMYLHKLFVDFYLNKFGIGFLAGACVYSIINLLMNFNHVLQSKVLNYNYIITIVAIFGLILNIILLKRKA